MRGRRRAAGDAARRDPARWARLGRTLGLVGGGVTVLAVLAFGVFPTRIYLDQRHDTAEAEQRLEVLRAQNEAYEARIARLQTDEEIERIAREDYNLVFPGEELYNVLPAPLPELDLPEVWPFGQLAPTAPSSDAPVGPPDDD